MAIGLALAAGGLALGKFLSKRGKKAKTEQTPLYIPPPYKASKYDAPSAEQLYKTYSGRARGEDVGFGKEDLGTMRAEAIDQAKLVERELSSRGLRGRRSTGATTTGGAATLREKSILGGLQARSQSLRDIAIRNAVLKRKEQSEGISGLFGFLGAEREEAHNIFSDEFSRAGVINQDIVRRDDEAATVKAYNVARQRETKGAIFDAVGSGLSTIWPGAGGASGSAVGGGGGGSGGLASVLGKFLSSRKSLSNYRGV